MENRRKNGFEMWQQRLQRVADNAVENAERQAKKYLRNFILTAEYDGELVYDVPEEKVDAVVEQQINEWMYMDFKCLLDHDRRYIFGITRLLCENGWVPNFPIDSDGNTLSEDELINRWDYLDKLVTAIVQNPVGPKLNSDFVYERRDNIGVVQAIRCSIDELEQIKKRLQNRPPRRIVPQDYTVVPIESYEQAQQFADYEPLCVFISPEEYNDYLKFGNMYVLLRHDIDSVQRPTRHPENPHDDFGMSLLVVYVDGDDYYVTGRWNDTKNNQAFLSRKELQLLLGRKFDLLK